MDSLMLSIIIAIAANLDNLSVGMAYGIQNIKISHTANFIIAVMSLCAAWLSGKVGEAVSLFLSPSTANILGAVLLCGVGLWVIAQPFITAYRTNRPLIDLEVLSKTRIYIGPTEILRYPERIDIDKSRDIGCWEAILLGFALSINALAGGFDAGAVGIYASVEAILIGLFSFITMGVGGYLGKKYAAEQFGKYATVIAGTLLILIGLHQLYG